MILLVGLFMGCTHGPIYIELVTPPTEFIIVVSSQLFQQQLLGCLN